MSFFSVALKQHLLPSGTVGENAAIKSRSAYTASHFKEGAQESETVTRAYLVIRRASCSLTPHDGGISLKSVACFKILRLG